MVLGFRVQMNVKKKRVENARISISEKLGGGEQRRRSRRSSGESLVGVLSNRLLEVRV